jgi:hypothetical protein
MQDNQFFSGVLIAFIAILILPLTAYTIQINYKLSLAKLDYPQSCYYNTTTEPEFMRCLYRYVTPKPKE